MNPELQRNFWLELTPRRLLFMPIVLGLIFLAASLGGIRRISDIGEAAEYAYYFLIFLWGTRTAAGAVAAEIRDRTWDGQRLSALTPLQMLIGKLVGSTSYQWYGALICLPLVAAGTLIEGGPAAMVAKLLYLVCVGIFGHSVALLTSLIAIHRRQALRRIDLFMYQVAGLAAAGSAATLWNSTFIARLLAGRPEAGVEQISWWGMSLPLDGFYLASLFIFLGWSLVGNLTLLRSELQVKTSPLPWIAFLLFSVVYGAGFAEGEAGPALTTLRLAIAILIAAGLTYAAILSEHKDPVLYRRMLAEVRKGQLARAYSSLQCWMISLALLTVLVFYFAASFEPPLQEVLGFTHKLAPAVIAGYFFVLRDVGVFLYFNMGQGARRGDFAAVIALGVFYLVLPPVIGGLVPGVGLGLFYPVPEGGALPSIGAPLIEAGVVWVLALGRLRGLLAPSAK